MTTADEDLRLMAAGRWIETTEGQALVAELAAAKAEVVAVRDRGRAKRLARAIGDERVPGSAPVRATGPVLTVLDGGVR